VPSRRPDAVARECGEEGAAPVIGTGSIPTRL
jgi:hypothetical protein